MNLQYQTNKIVIYNTNSLSNTYNQNIMETKNILDQPIYHGHFKKL